MHPQAGPNQVRHHHTQIAIWLESARMRWSHHPCIFPAPVCFQRLPSINGLIIK